jgi:hypothetical protein
MFWQVISDTVPCSAIMIILKEEKSFPSTPSPYLYDLPSGLFYSSDAIICNSLLNLNAARMKSFLPELNAAPLLPYCWEMQHNNVQFIAKNRA